MRNGVYRRCGSALCGIVLGILINQMALAEKVLHSQLNPAVAKDLITQYYNKNGLLSSQYQIHSIKRIRLKRIGNRRVIAHVEYEYTQTPGAKPSHGVDKRTFTLIKAQHWNVVGMGKHNSASF